MSTTYSRCRPRASPSAIAAGSATRHGRTPGPWRPCGQTVTLTAPSQFVGPGGGDARRRERLPHPVRLRVGRDDPDRPLVRAPPPRPRPPRRQSRRRSGRILNSPSLRRDRAAGTSTSSRASSRFASPDHRLRHPEADGQRHDHRLRASQVGEQFAPLRAAHGVVPCARSPSTVSDPKPRAAADRPALHRRQVLRLVDHQVPVALGVFDEPGDLVEEDEIGRRPRDRRPARTRAAPAAPARPAARLLFAAASTQPVRRGQRGRIGEQFATTSSGRALGHTASTYAPTGRAREIFCTQAFDWARHAARPAPARPHDPRPDPLTPDGVRQFLGPYARPRSARAPQRAPATGTNRRAPRAGPLRPRRRPARRGLAAAPPPSGRRA